MGCGLAELIEAELWAPLVTRDKLVTRDREACAVQDAAGKYPVDLAIERGAPPELVLKMHAAGGLMVAVNREDWETATRLVLAQPQLTREKDEYGSLLGGMLPLYHGAPLRLVVALFEAYPEALAAKSKYGNTPLAYAQLQRYSERQQPGVLDCLQHYAALHKAAERRDWGALAAFQRRDGGAPAAWVAALAQRHGAPASTIEALSETFGLAELVAAGLWAPLATRVDALITREACAAQDAVGQYPLALAIAGQVPLRCARGIVRMRGSLGAGVPARS